MLTELTTNNNHDEIEEEEEEDLGHRVLTYIANESEKSDVRAGKVAVALGISVDDAEAELCGLLSTLGCGSFRFDSDSGAMIFQFPDNVASLGSAVRRKESFFETIYAIGFSVMTFLRFLAGIGILISIAIVTVVAVVVVVAGFIALMTSDRGRMHGNGGLRRLRMILFSIREIFWLYAMFGGGGNPFFQDLSYEASSCLNLILLSPFSPCFWLNLMMMNRRRRSRRRWGVRSTRQTSTLPNERESFLATSPSTSSNSSNIGSNLTARYVLSLAVQYYRELYLNEIFLNYIFCRDILAIVDEFLFGPSKTPGPDASERWKLRAAVILNRPSSIISLEDLLPFVDNPPRAGSSITYASLSIVSYFRGKPATNVPDQISDKSSTNELFRFDELSMEADEITSIFNETKQFTIALESDKNCIPSLYKQARKYVIDMGLPEFMIERKYCFTKLDQMIFYKCAFVAVMNFLGILWIQGYLNGTELGETLELSYPALATLMSILLKILSAYAKFFILFPLFRFVLITLMNIAIVNRNRIRMAIAAELSNR